MRAALAHLRYPPEGDRGVATYNRACGFGLRTDALDSANDEVIGVIQIESVAALEHVEAIAEQPGVDVLFVGPRDLTHALGVPGRVDAPGVPRRAAARRGRGTGGRRRRPACWPRAARPPRTYVAEGFGFVGIGSDSSFVGEPPRARPPPN